MEHPSSEGTRRAPAVAGTFYPAAAEALRALVDQLLDAALEAAGALGGCTPKALIVPHAGYAYSGPIAARAYALVAGLGAVIERVVLVGPAHHFHVGGVVAPGAAALATPLGDMAVDQAALAGAPGVVDAPRAHAPEHSLEVQLPFLQRLLPHARVVPLLVSDAAPAEIGAVLEGLWGGPETLIVVSSDLSHYLSYAAAAQLDGETAARIVDLDPRPLGPERACGAACINALTWVARRKHLRPLLVDLRSSGDTAGTRQRVVGYGAFAYLESGDAD